MIGDRETQEPLFIPGSLRDLIPDDHILKQVNAILDLRWVRDAVKDCYTLNNGRPSIPPECAVRLMLAGFFLGIVHDRKLMREAQVNLAIRWFAGYGLERSLPEHSSLTRIRQRWGAQRFRQIFLRTVQQCLEAGLVSGETVHVDATLIRADVSWESVALQHAEQTLTENALPDDPLPDQPPLGRGGPPKPQAKKRSATDPEATLATSCRQYHLEPTYKQHAVVDDQAGVIVDVALTTGETSEGTQLTDQLDRVTATLGQAPTTVTSDTGYAHSANYAACEARNIDPVIPPQRLTRRRHERIPARRFRYDAMHQRVRCPRGKTLLPRGRTAHAQVFRACAADCGRCPLRARCFAPSGNARSVIIPAGYEALLRARRRQVRGWDEATRTAYRRHRWRVEGVHGEAKTQHGLRRAVRRGLANVAIQVYLTAAAMNLKRLARQPAVVHAAITRCKRLIVRFWASLGGRHQKTACRRGNVTTLLPQAA
jgi:transposase